MNDPTSALSVGRALQLRTVLSSSSSSAPKPLFVLECAKDDPGTQVIKEFVPAKGLARRARAAAEANMDAKPLDFTETGVK